MTLDNIDTTGQLIELMASIDRLAELCELNRQIAWDHPEPPFDDDEWVVFDDKE